jgi:hypothetical protein
VDWDGYPTALFAEAISEIRANPRSFRGEGVTAVCELPGGRGLNPPAIGANPLADCTSNPSGG